MFQMCCLRPSVPVEMLLGRSSHVMSLYAVSGFIVCGIVDALGREGWEDESLIVMARLMNGPIGLVQKWRSQGCKHGT